MKKKKKTEVLYEENVKSLKPLVVIFLIAIIINIASLYPFELIRSVIYIPVNIIELLILFAMNNNLKKHKLFGGTLEILFGSIMYLCSLSLILFSPLFFAVTFFEGLIGILIIDQGLDFYRLLSEHKDVKKEEYVYAENINDEHREIITNDINEYTNEV